ncbi:hypothetical protein E2C01_068399 [Portunus trituberculatus]|uniref:Uncharacterized protein n=1 Tax=Portunus trituberculatus TaxID=210409 RepID=A0A5B7HZY8_PORTR|nr:hypothetical protein [Portunus trituberculatus]
MEEDRLCEAGSHTNTQPSTIHLVPRNGPAAYPRREIRDCDGKQISSRRNSSTEIEARKNYLQKGHSTNRWFLVYSCYAWGLSLLVCLLAVARDFSTGLQNSFLPKPNFGQGRCWFSVRLNPFSTMTRFRINSAYYLVILYSFRFSCERLR